MSMNKKSWVTASIVFIVSIVSITSVTYADVQTNDAVQPDASLFAANTSNPTASVIIKPQEVTGRGANGEMQSAVMGEDGKWVAPQKEPVTPAAAAAVQPPASATVTPPPVPVSVPLTIPNPSDVINKK